MTAPMREVRSDMPLFSVVVPCYRIAHRPELVEQCVASIARQDCQDFELLLVDDGSADGSAAVLQEILARCAALQERGRVLALAQNGGVCVARNAGIDAARGEYIAFLDFDDLWQSQYLDQVRLAIDARPAAQVYLVRTDFLTVFGARTRVFSSGSIGHLNELDAADFNAWHLLHNFPVGMGSALVLARRLFVTHPELRFDVALSRTTAEDVLLGFQLLDHGIRPWYVDQPLCMHRRIIGQRSRGTHAYLSLNERQVNDYIAMQAADRLTASVIARKPAYAAAFHAQRERLNLQFDLKQEYLQARTAFGLRRCLRQPRGLRHLLRLHAEHALGRGPLAGLLHQYQFLRSGQDVLAHARVAALLASVQQRHYQVSA
jgi:glycosyltransferase involved in cell wall biosynthesis